MMKYLSTFLTVLFTTISFSAFATEMEINNSDVYIDQNKITIGTSLEKTEIEQSAKRLKFILPSSDGTNYIDISDSLGNLFFIINSLGQIQSQNTFGLEIIDPITLADVFFLNNTHTVSLDTNNTDNLIAAFANSGTWSFAFQNDNDGTSELGVTNSDGAQTFAARSDGSVEITKKGTTTDFPLEINDQVAAGVGTTGQSLLVETYRDRQSMLRLDGVMDGGVLFDMRNANNAVERSDKASDFWGSSDWMWLTDQNGTFYKWLFAGTELWLRSSTWSVEHNGAGLNPAFQWRTYQTNTSDFRWRNPTGYVDFQTFDNGGEAGIQYLASTTALGGVRWNVPNGELNLLANEDVVLTSTTGNIVTSNTLQAPTIQGGSGSGDDLTLLSTSDATKGKIYFGANSAYDEVNDRLGIGITSPLHQLSLLDNTPTGVHANNTAGASLALLAGGGASTFTFSNNLAFSIQSATKANIDNNTLTLNVTKHLTVDPTTGYVAIGEDFINPTARLHVKGAGNTSATYASKIQNSDGTDIASFRDDGNVGIGNSGLRVWANGRTAGRLDTAPVALFQTDALKDLWYSDDGTTPTWRLSYNSIPVIDMSMSGGYIGVISNPSTNSTNGLWLGAGTPNTYDLQLEFTKTGNSVFRNGNVAIGNITPTARAHIQGSGNTSATDALLVQNIDSTDLLKVRDDGIVTANKAIYLGDGDTGFYESADDTLTLIANGGNVFRLNANGIDSIPFAGDSGAYLRKIAATATVPVYTFGDSDTGMGRAGDDQLSLIAGGVEGIRVENGKNKHFGATFKKPTDVTAATYSILATDNFVGVSYTATGAATVELPSLADAWDSTTGTGQEIIIKDTGANAGTNNITINRKAATSDTIITTATGQTSFAISTDGGSVILRAISATEWALF